MTSTAAALVGEKERDALTQEVLGGRVSAPLLKFVRPEAEYAHFLPEVAIDGDDLVFHFFLVPGQVEGRRPSDVEHFWGDTFPRALSDTAEAHFAATYPRLRAARVQDTEMSLDSWWFRAGGFAQSVHDVEAFVRRFYERLDASLSSNST